MDYEKIEKALHKIASPTALIGSRKNDTHDLATVSWFVQESVYPPQIVVNVAKNRFIYSILDETKEFMISILPEGTEKWADLCGHTSGRDIDKVQALDIKTKIAEVINVPKIDGAVANIECRVADMFESGDHILVIGTVVAAEFDDSKRPIVSFDGEYNKIALNH